jgi:hypothetical protein
MTERVTHADHLFHLAEAVCDETASEGDVVELDEILFKDENSRRRYQDYCRLHFTLEQELQMLSSVQRVHQQIDLEPDLIGPNSIAMDSVSSTPSANLPVYGFGPSSLNGLGGYLSSGWPMAYLIATAIFAVGAMIGVSVPATRLLQVVSDSSPTAPRLSRHQEASSVVGRITGMVNCVWEGSGFRGLGAGTNNPTSEILHQKSVIALGDRLVLRSGLLEITYATGAKVILQGPVTYQVDSAAGGHLSVGKLTARLEKKAEYGMRNAEEASHSQSPFHLPPSTFVITTPTAIVTDLGTEFGVEVSEKGSTKSHVFRGSVQVRARGVDGKIQGTAKVLHENQSARVERTGNPDDGDRVIVVDPSAEAMTFVRAISRRESRQLDRFDVIAHWQFDGKDFLADSSGHGHTLVNHGAVQVDGAASFDGKAIMSTVDSVDLTPYKKIRVTWSLKTPTSTTSQVLWEHSARYTDTHGAIIGYLEAGEGFAGLRNHLDDREDPFRVETYPVRSDQWETFVAEYDLTSARRSGMISVSNNGVLVGRGTAANDVAAESFAKARFYIGARETMRFPFVGQIDNLKIEGVAKGR